MTDAQMTGPMTGGRYAGFWWRVLAAIIDGVILFIAMKIVQFALGMVMGAPAVPDLSGYDMNDPTQAAEAQMKIAEAGAFGALGLIGMLLSIVIYWLYFALQESSKCQATVGKKICGLYVTDEAGNPLTFGRATGRYFGKILSSLIVGIGYIMVAFTSKKQGLHDILAKTLVMKK